MPLRKLMAAAVWSMIHRMDQLTPLSKRGVTLLRTHGWEPSLVMTTIRRTGSIWLTRMTRHLHRNDARTENRKPKYPYQIRLAYYEPEATSRSARSWIFGCIVAALPVSVLLVFKQSHRTIPTTMAASIIGICGAIAAVSFALSAARSRSLRERLWSLVGVAFTCAMLYRSTAWAQSDFLAYNARIKCLPGVNPNPRISLNAVRLATGCAWLGPIASFKGLHQLPSDYVAIVDWGSGRPKIARITRPDPGGPFIISTDENDVFPSTGRMIVISVTDVLYDVTTVIELPLKTK